MDKNKELQRKQEDAAFAHGLWWVGGAILVEILLVLINKYYFHFTTAPESVAKAEFTYNMMRVFFVVAPLVFLAAGVKGYLQFKKTGTICPLIEATLGLSGAISLVCSMCLVYKADGCSMMLLFVPAAGALAFGFFLYQHDFFYSAAICGMATMVMWMVWHVTPNNKFIGIIGAIKIIVFSALLCWVANLLKKSDGTLTLLGHSVRFLPSDALYHVIYASAGLSAATAVLGLLLGGYVAYFLIYVLAAWIFALLVYYTVRML